MLRKLVVLAITSGIAARLIKRYNQSRRLSSSSPSSSRWPAATGRSSTPSVTTQSGQMGSTGE